MIPLKDNIPTDRLPLVTIGLILANVVVYLLAVSHGGSIISGPDAYETTKYSSIPFALTHCLTHRELIEGGQLVCSTNQGIPTWATVFTAMFMHASILHIGGNMLFLWIFGNNVEDSMGRLRFLLFYLLGGVAALALQVAVSPNAVVPTLGASGAIAAALGGYIVLYPRARVLTLVFIVLFFTVLELPAIVVLGLWFVEQAVFSATGLITPSGGGGGGVAYYAHVGGFVFGLLLVRAFATRRKAVPPRPRRL